MLRMLIVLLIGILIGAILFGGLLPGSKYDTRLPNTRDGVATPNEPAPGYEDPEEVSIDVDMDLEGDPDPTDVTLDPDEASLDGNLSDDEPADDDGR